MLTSRNHKFAVSRKMFASFLLLLVTSAILSTIVAVMAQPTEISVINSETGDNNFVFYTNTTTVGTRFNATIWLDDINVTDPGLFAYQVYLTVNDTFLNITNAWLPTWNSSWVFDGITTMQVAPAFYDLDTDGVTEAVKIGDTILLGDRFNGSGLLAVIEFEMIYAPTTGSVSCNLDIDNADTYLLDDFLTEISPITKTSGYYEYFSAPMGTSVITISVFPANVTTYSNVTVSGNITPIRANVTVTIHYRNASYPWTILATVSTNSSSDYYYVWQTTEPGIFELYANWTGDLVTEGASSEIKVVTVEDDNTPPEIHDVYQQPTEDNVYPDDKVEVYANVTDDLSGVKQVILNYTTNNGTWFDQEMTNLSGNLYNATIPPYPYCTTVTYVVIAEDNFNNTITTEELEYDTQYHVIPEFPSTTVLLTIVLTTLAAAIIRKKRLSKKILSNKLYLD